MTNMTFIEFRFQLFRIKSQLTNLEKIAESLFQINSPSPDLRLSAKILNQMVADLDILKKQALDLQVLSARVTVLP